MMRKLSELCGSRRQGPLFLKRENDRWIRLAGAFAIVSSGISAQAHPGHSMNEATMQHLLSSPYHLALLASSGAALWFAGRFVQRRFERRLLQSAGVATALLAGVVWGLRL